MTGIFGQLTPPGVPGQWGDKAPAKEPLDAHTVDVPAIGTAERKGCLCTLERTAIRNRLRVAQLLLTIGALALIRPQYNDGVQWTTLFALCHTFVISFVLLWDQHCSGTVVRSQLPLLDWRRLELWYTAIATVALYGLAYGVLFAHKGYGGWYVCNWVSSVLTLLTALAYGGETWLQLRDKYDGRTAIGQ
uniref:MARVEL domain-containing protein n=1 Tax=Anopheles melas TaxID=34690 RepID=A0A182UBJ2_9DIPT